MVFLLHFLDMVYTVDNDNHLICCATNAIIVLMETFD